MQADRVERNVALVAGAGLFAWFLWLIRGGLRSWFENDDLMNIHVYWVDTWAALLKANLEFWSSFYRPGGGLFYKLLYDLFGFHPLPFRVAALVLLAVDFILLAIVVWQLTRSYFAALLAWMLVGINPSFGFAYYNTGIIYDVLGYTWFWGCFALYLHLRRRGRVPGWGGFAAIFILFVMALNTKELAVSLPVAVGLYELLWHPPARWDGAGLWRWIRNEGRFAAIGAIADVAFVLGKRYGPNSLWQIGPYQPHYSWAAYFQSMATYVGQLIYNLSRHGYKPPTITPPQIEWTLLAMLIVSVVLRHRVLLWAFGFICAGILPLAFIPTRGGSAFLAPSVGWAVYATALVDWAIVKLTRRPAMLRPAVEAAVLLIVLVILIPWHRQILAYAKPAYEIQGRYHGYIDQIRALIPAPKKGARILLLTDAEGRDDYDVYFVMRLYYGDPKLDVERMRVWNDHHVKVDPASYDYVLDWVDNHFVLVSRK